MKSLVCLTVADGRIVTARVESFVKVGDLVNLLKKEHPSLISCEAADVTLWMAKKESGEWLKSSDVDAKQRDETTKIERNRMDVTFRLNNAGFDFPEEDNEDAEDGVVHVLVGVPNSKSGEPDLIKRHPNRKRRWEQLNAYFASIQQQIEEADASGFPFLDPEDADKIIKAERYEQPTKPIPDEKLEVLHEYLALLTESVGNIDGVKDRKHFILPVLASVCVLFAGDARIRDNYTVTGERVNAQVTFDFVIERGNKRLCVVEATHGNFQQALAKAYVGCEVITDVEGLTEVYSVVTNFVEWRFSRSRKEEMERDDDAIVSMGTRESARKSVKVIAEKIYSMLSDDE